MRIIISSIRRFSYTVRQYPFADGFKRFTKVAFSDRYLIYSNMTISVSLSALGDYLEQNYEIYTKELDTWNKSRTLHMAFSGMTVGFICHHWYKYLDRRIPGRTLVNVVKKVLADQMICSPVIIFTFFGSVALFEDVTLGEFKDELKHKFLRLYRAEWVVWPPAQIINFCFLPTKFRVLYDNTISLGYDIFTSQVKHSKVESCNKNDGKSDKESIRIAELSNQSTTIKNNLLNVS